MTIPSVRCDHCGCDIGPDDSWIRDQDELRCADCATPHLVARYNAMLYEEFRENRAKCFWRMAFVFVAVPFVVHMFSEYWGHR